MNGVRSISMRKGYLLTALAAAVLLAASSGTAWAQDVGFRTTSGTLGEGATAATRTADPLHLYIDISGIKTGDDAPDDGTGVGTLTLVHLLDAGGLSNADPKEDDARRVWQKVGNDLIAIVTNDTELDYTGNGRLELVIIDPLEGEDTNWKDEKYTIKLESSEDDIGPSPSLFTATIIDRDVAPVAKFSKPMISLTEDSNTTVDVQIRPGTKTAAKQGELDDGVVLSIMVSDMDMVGACLDGTDASGKALDIQLASGNSVMIDEETSAFTLAEFGMDGDATADGPTLSLIACEDDDGFRDPEVTLSFTAKSLMSAAGAAGALTDGGSLAIMVQSNEEVPTVTFATSRLDIDEGGTNTVAILASESTGPEVGSVMVSVSGDAMLSLWQDDDMLEAGTDGMYEVDLMGNANTILTISADSDRALEDGMTSTGTITLMSASGAEIGDRDSVMVTVIGSTAVPALPLVGQLLLALFLMAGGARLYRRRNG